MSEAKKEKKVRKVSARRPGERFRVALTKGDAKLSFSVSPSASGYTLRARTKSPEAGARIAAEPFETFEPAKARAEALLLAATSKGWIEKKSTRSIEDLLD